MAGKEEIKNRKFAGVQEQQRQDEVSKSQSAPSSLNWTGQAADDFPAVGKISKQTRQCKETVCFEPRYNKDETCINVASSNVDDWQKPALDLEKNRKELKETDKVKSIQMASEVEVKDKHLLEEQPHEKSLFFLIKAKDEVAANLKHEPEENGKQHEGHAQVS